MVTTKYLTPPSLIAKSLVSERQSYPGRYRYWTSPARSPTCFSRSRTRCHPLVRTPMILIHVALTMDGLHEGCPDLCRHTALVSLTLGVEVGDEWRSQRGNGSIHN